ncbi:unnamed protein product [marine sediment metagenome]|uniref:Uncharacterized protein n=1 Tax=marine sediment metagenome TaxID=412755 RepID=X1S4S9_9ZZZZ
MAKIEGILVVMLCINIMLVIGGIFDVDTGSTSGNIIASLFAFEGDETSGLSADFQEEVEGVGSEGALQTTSGFEGFTDLPRAIFNMFKFLLISLTAPLVLFFNPVLQLPYQFRLMVALPMSIVWILAIIRFFRKGD